jgi:hypothetical protein
VVHIDEMKFSSNLNEAIVASLQLGGGESQQELSDFYFPVYSDRRENLDQRPAMQVYSSSMKKNLIL